MLRHAHQNKKQTPLFLGFYGVLRIQKKRKYKLPLFPLVVQKDKYEEKYTK